ncbi:hypothetical protein Q1J61_12155, partial [Pseudomonas putida]|uniref:hypothetical protein n=1 Tax=Pseudomonas putida TaxID=303 RepID=UPI0034D4017B
FKDFSKNTAGVTVDYQSKGGLVSRSGCAAAPPIQTFFAEPEGPLCGPIATQGRSCKGPGQPADPSR